MAAEGAILSDTAALQEMLGAESDRGLITILVSYVEDELVKRICAAVPNGKDFQKTINNGPLRNFEHRVALARGLGVVTDSQADMLDVLRHMRNAAAHSRQPISLQTPEMKEAFELLFVQGPSRAAVQSGSVPQQGALILAASYLLTMLQGRTVAELRASVSGARTADPKVVQMERVLFEALQQKQTSKQVPGPPPPPSETGR